VNSISDAADLMATAREALLNEVLPSLPKDRRYAGLMIANVMAMAAREHAHGGAALRAEAERLRTLLGGFDPLATRPSDGNDDELRALRRALSVAIRRGRFDERSSRRTLESHIALTATDWVAISNPKVVRSKRND
jgi:hypothetical protein